jgi:4-amino-4-deoxy-L-arabinose transferase-like glycosyltransferase
MNASGSRRSIVRGVAVILVVAVLTRLVFAFVLARHMPLVSDALSYDENAREMLVRFPGEKAFYWPPGTSLFLAGGYRILGASVAAARALTLVAGVASVVLTWLIARQALSSEKAQRATAIVAAVYTPAVMLTPQCYSQHFAGLALLALAYFGGRAFKEQRIHLYGLAGLALGAGCIIRASMLLLVPLVTVVLLVKGWRSRERRQVLGGIILMPALAIALIAPVEAHNAAHGAGWEISTNTERNFFLGNNPYTHDYKTSHLGQRSLDELEPTTRAYLEGFYRLPDARAQMRAEAVRFMVEHPFVTLKRTFNRTTSFWGFDYLATRTIGEHFGLGKKGQALLLLVEASGYVLTVLLVLIGLFSRSAAQAVDGEWRRWLVMLVVAYQLPYCFAFSSGTYHFPVIGLLQPLAGAGAMAIAARTGGSLRTLATELRGALVPAVLFLVIQVQYAYYAILLA